MFSECSSLLSKWRTLTSCPRQKCSVSDLAQLLQCQKCHQRVCLKHRWQDQHTCAPQRRNVPAAPSRGKSIVVH